MWSPATSLRFLARMLLLSALALSLGAIAHLPSADAQSGNSTWSIIGSTPGSGGIAEAVLGYDNFFLVVRQTSTQADADTWLYQSTGEGGQLRLIDSLLTPPIRFEPGLSLTWDGNRYMYVLIGANYNTRNRTGFLRYDTCLRQAQSCANSWQFLAPTPIEQGPGNAIAFARIGNREYVYAFLGSSTAERTDAANTFARYDVSTGLWQTLSHPPAWGCTDDGVALEWDRANFIYALNGSDCNDRASTRVSRYSLSGGGGTWQPVASIPQAVDGGGSLVYDNNGGLIALAGAGISLPSGRGEDAFRFDLSTLEWEELPDLPCPVGGFSGERLGLVGGHIFAWQGNEVFARCNGSALMRYDH